MALDNVQEEMKNKLQYICEQFRIPGEVILSRWIPNGHINEAYYVAVYDGKESLATGAAVITLELASRFLGDYLTGDKYFRIDTPDQNLRRAKAQLVLFQDMMAHMENMKQIIREVAAK